MSSEPGKTREHRAAFARAIVPLCLVAAVALTIAAACRRPLPGDLATMRAIQESAVPGADDVARAVNWLGLGLRLTLVALPIAIGLALAGRKGAAAVIVAAQLVRVLNPLLKDVIDRPRPSPDLVRLTEQVSGSSFPSGHALGAVLFYGSLALVAREAIGRRWLRIVTQIVAVAAIALAGFGRIYVGAHWLSDVIGGYLWGTILLLVVVQLRRRIDP
jgi:undecaprenyl-diphosphatase